jgi:signal transduction histidine kinase/DNA-binding response OmpR family regulator
MSIKTQVALGCGVMVIVVAAFAAYSRELNRDVAANIAVVADRAMPQVQAAGDLGAAFAGVEAARHQVVTANTVAEHDDRYPIDTPPGQTEPAKAARRSLVRALTLVETRLAEVRALATASAGGPPADLKSLDEEFAAYRRDIDDLVAEIEHGTAAAARTYLSVAIESRYARKIAPIIATLTRRAHEDAGRASTSAVRTIELASHLQWMAALAALGVAIVVALVTGRSVTRSGRVLAEARLAAEAGSRAKSEFLANMSHEVRTPMNGVFGMAELLADTPLTPLQREYLATLRSSADGLLGVINDILDVSKLEAGKLHLEQAEFDLAEVVAEATRTLAVKAHQWGLELVYRIAPGGPECVVGDALRLRQVLLNLIGNAVKFTERGEVTVEVAVSRESMETWGAHFAVRDTGVGIAADEIERLFAPFEQADMSTTRRHGGTGLGLTITRHLVEKMGGRVWVDSTPGEGSTFHFTARFAVAAPGATAPPPPADEPAVPLAGRRVLIVDDNDTNRRVLEEMSHGWGMRPVAVPSGAAAIASVETAWTAGEPYEVVLLDVKMPGMDGFDVAEAMAPNPHMAGATIVMLTSDDRGQDQSRCEALGLSAYMIKPITKRDLLRNLQRALRRRDAVAPCAVLPAAASSPSPAEAPAATAGTDPGEPAGSALRRLRVLVAEDNEVNVRLSVALLAKLGHTATVVGDGQAAVDAHGTGAFDLILMDVQMPVMGGMDATRRIREAEAQAPASIAPHVPIVALTARAMKGDREECLAAGMDDYVTKPVRLSDLAAAVARQIPGMPPSARATGDAA